MIAPPEERRAAFRLVDGNPRRGSERQCIDDVFPFILPEVKLVLSQVVDYWDFECTALSGGQAGPRNVADHERVGGMHLEALIAVALPAAL
jgi:hypothetical protein